MAGDGPPRHQRIIEQRNDSGLQRSISRLVRCAHSLLAQLAAQRLAQRLAQRGAAPNVSSSTGLSAKPHLVALVRAGARFEMGKLVERPDKSRDDQQVA
jgi:hypothetical protein